MLNRSRNAFIVFVTMMLLSACASTGLQGPSQVEYGHMDEEAQAKARAEVKKLTKGLK